RAVPELADEEAREEVLLVGGRALDERRHESHAPPRRSRPRLAPDRRERAIDVVEGEVGRAGGRALANLAELRVADADLSLRQLAGEIGDGESQAARIAREPAQVLGDVRDLLVARARRADLARGFDELEERCASA